MGENKTKQNKNTHKELACRNLVQSCTAICNTTQFKLEFSIHTPIVLKSQQTGMHDGLGAGVAKGWLVTHLVLLLLP